MMSIFNRLSLHRRQLRPLRSLSLLFETTFGNGLDSLVGACCPFGRRTILTKLFAGPQAKKEEDERSACGHTWTDHYRWLEEGGEQLRSYLQDETEYAKQILKGKVKHLKAFRQQIKEASAPVKEFPEVWWPYEYWAEPSEVDPDDQAFFRRRLDKPDAGAELLVDTGSLEDDYGQTGVGGIKMSPCQKYMAMLTEFEKGSESYSVHILDLDEGNDASPDNRVYVQFQGKVLEDEIIHPDVSGCEWSNDSKKLIYTVHDDQRRPHRVCVHVLGKSVKEDACLLEEPDVKYYLHVGSTKSREYIVITAASKMSSEVSLLPGLVEKPYALTLVQKRRPGLEYFVEVWNHQLVILSNNTISGNYALNVANIAEPGIEHWQLMIDHSLDFTIEDLEMNKHKCVLLTRSYKGQGLCVIDMETDNRRPMEVPLPDWCRQIALGANLDYNADTFAFFASSPIHRTEAFEYNFRTHQCQVHPLEDAYKEFQDEGFECVTETVRTRDGAMVPLTLAFKKGLKLDGSSPCLLEVYGAYGHALDLGFQPHRQPLLTNGWILAFGHVRGGGELGRQWHKEGRLEKKQNSISDCEAVMRHLIDKGRSTVPTVCGCLCIGYTSAGQIALESFSAGAVIAGAIINKRPNLLLAAILQVPFLDVLTVLTDEKQPLTVHEYDEWGDPNDPAAFDRIRDLCPYQNVRENVYPGIFVTCGYNDSRVPVWGPAKWVSKLKDNQVGNAAVFLYTDFEAGHFSSESERNALRDLQYSYLMYLWEQYRQ